MAERTPEQNFLRWRSQCDARALGRVFDELAPELLIVAHHVAGTAHAEDLVQATFVEAMQHADRFDPDRPLRPWLVGILVRLARRQQQRDGRRLDPNRLEPSPESKGPDELLAEEERALAVAEAVRGLPSDYRRTLTLRFAHGLTPTAIAHALEEPVATVKSRLRRGVELLRKSLPASVAVPGIVGVELRGLGEVRAAVLEHGKLLAAGSSGTGTVAALTGGGVGLLMNKFVWSAVVSGIVLFGVLAQVWPDPADAAPASLRAESSGLAATTGFEGSAESSPESAAAQRTVAPRVVPDAAAQAGASAATEGSIGGRVVDARGTPLAGVEVLLALPGRSNAYQGVRTFLLARASQPGDVPVPEGGARTVTGTDGSFAFERPDDDLQRALIAWAPELGCAHADVAAGEPADALLLAIEDGAPLHGTVTREGDRGPLPGASVGVYPARTGMPIAFLRTDDEGRFATPPLPDGAYRAYAEADGYRREFERLQSGQTDVHFELTRLPVLDAVLVDQHRHAWTADRVRAVLGAGADVRITLTRESFARRSELDVDPHEHAELHLDPASGRLHGTLVDEQARVLTAWRGPWKLGEAELPPTTAAGDLAEPVVLPLEAPATRALEVGIELVPPPDRARIARVTLADTGAFGQRIDPIQTVETAAGAVTLNVPEQFVGRTCALLVEVEGYVEYFARLPVTEAAAAGEAWHRARLVPAEHALRGRILDADGKPPVRATVVIVRPDGTPLRAPRKSLRESVDDGLFEFTGLPAGPLRVFVTADGAAPAGQDLEIREDQEVEMRLATGRELRIRFGRGMEARLRVCDVHGRPLLDDRVTGTTRYGSGASLRVDSKAQRVEVYDAVTGALELEGAIPATGDLVLR